jgi:hypothetical protein
LTLSFLIVFIPTERQKIPYFYFVAQLYGGLAILIIFALLFGINIYVWQRFGINYVFIFEFNPRDYLSFHEYIEVSYIYIYIYLLEDD